MIVLNREVQASFVMLRQLSASRKRDDKDKDVPAIRGALRFDLARILQQLEPIAEAFNTTRTETFLAHGGKSVQVAEIPGATRWEFEDDNDRVKATGELTALLSKEIEITGERIPLEKLEAYIELTADEITALSWLLELP